MIHLYATKHYINVQSGQELVMGMLEREIIRQVRYKWVKKDK
jgi:hypothetical protein